MNKKQLFGFTALSLLFIVGIIYLLSRLHQNEQEDIDLAKLSQELDRKGYHIGVISYSPKNKEMIVQLSNKEPNLSHTKEAIKNYIKNELEDHNVSIQVKIIDVEQAERERKWMSVVSKIDKKLKRESNKYIGIAIGFNPQSITYILKSSYSESDFAEKEIKDWMELTNNVIVSQNLPSLLKNDETYEIEVISKNKEVLQNKRYNHNVESYDD
ncbi:hypothetical protein PNH38_05225 [Anoxybacillus rupiensis]|jgi:galactitol-specific phosphotransferase system IIB component|uniref:Uncharacterized protein n=1 Tax=Anoxybacteroides rupiense TaxID=311460 RepID=A0ABT5W1T2_9BACL|nr:MULTISPECIES: hypothetical protein [Anoxybacillus]MBS2772861.1 hypothetical protein [Anoxybacillus rupiensis]MDE8563287.1 hypothetical protein [Anoxybacillus rupiensis]QHC03839.1 hypothetical protein GRQ40_07525 [Anoxybacillus sp. PDR2]